MRYARDCDDETAREDLIGLRVVQTRLLVERGVVRRDAEGEEIRLPVLASTGRGGANDPTAHFLAIDGRIVVPAEHVGAVQEILGDAVGEVAPLARTRFATVVLRGVAVTDALDRLAAAAPTLRAAPQHLIFPAFRGRGQEGEDPEPVDPAEVGAPGRVRLGGGVKVAVVDTGVAETALADPWMAGIHPAPADVDPLRERETRHEPTTGALYQDLGAGHGTMVIGVLREVAPGCEVEVIRALDTDGIATDDEIARAIDDAVARGADLINLSLGGYTDRNLPPPVIEDALQRVPGDILVVAAAGNYFDDRPVWPGAIRRVVSVAALDQKGNEPAAVNPRLAAYSSFGWWVDVAAPGTWATPFVKGWENPDRETDGHPDHFDGYAEAAGTSLAAAAITGAIAVELSRLRSASPPTADVAAAASPTSDAAASPPATARHALLAVLGRRGNVRMPQGTMAVDVWEDD